MKAISLAGALVFLCSSPSVLTQWSADPGLNTPICTVSNSQNVPTLVASDAGAAIITWYDDRDSLSAGSDIYAQKVDAAGVAQWVPNGVGICTATDRQDLPVIVGDGAGGALIAWEDRRSGTNADIYVQKVSADGVAQWTTNGVAVCTATGDQVLPAIASDGTGGAIITWEDNRNGSADIYAQRVNTEGVAQWAANGVEVCTAANNQNVPRIVSDGAGGALITWQDRRGGTDDDIYAQRLNAAGAAQWTANGAPICTAANVQALPSIAGGGDGGAIITWRDHRSGTHDDIYAQKVSPAGMAQWEANGAALCTTSDLKDAPTLASDDAGGAIITWDEVRGSTNYDIYAQLISAAGVVQWTANGAPICTAPGLQLGPMIISDGAGGAIIAWNDLRSGRDYDVYAQKVDAAGLPQWTADGMAISSATGVQALPAIVSDGSEGAIITWEDYRSGSTSDVFAQRVLLNGNLGIPAGVPENMNSRPEMLSLGQNYPNPFNSSTVITYALPSDARVSLTIFNLLGQEVRRLLDGEEHAGYRSVRFDANDLPSGLYFYRLKSGTLSRTRKLILAK